MGVLYGIMSGSGLKQMGVDVSGGAKLPVSCPGGKDEAQVDAGR